jgi:phage tail-like protein
VASTRPFALVVTLDQWLRAAHQGTALDTDDRCVELAWTSESIERPEEPAAAPAGGLAFDGACRVYHGVPAGGRIERAPWGVRDPFRRPAAAPTSIDLLGATDPAIVADFAPSLLSSDLTAPSGLAVDAHEHLFVAEPGKNRILVHDLGRRRLIRVEKLAAEGAAGPRPVDLAAHGRSVYALTESPARLFVLSARSAAAPRALPAGIASPSRVAVSPSGRVAVLDPAAGKVHFVDEGTSFDIPTRASDLEFETDEILVVARRPGEDFVRVRVGAAATRFEAPTLKAPGYREPWIVRTPDRRIGYWSDAGFRHAVSARRRYEPSGRVTTFRLDSGEWQTSWGRLFLDACIPEGTEVRVHCVTADEVPEEGTLARTPPANIGLAAALYPELSPPMPPASFAPRPGDFHPIHRRESGRELPWATAPADDRFVTYEAPILAGAGRFLWITLELTGTTRVSPRVRCLRAEHPSHDYLRRLPRTFSRDEGAASFLRRYLAIFEGFLGEVDARGAERAALLDPRAAPEEVLPWLASFLGLALDGRWSVEQKRTLIAEIADLWRARGTVRGLARMLEIYLGVAPAVIEHFRLPGPGGSVLGIDGAAVPATVVGATFRVGGARSTGPRAADAPPAADATSTHAHRFTVVIPGALDDEQRAVVADVIEAHKPAHTLHEVCCVAGGVRLGAGLLVGVSTLVGRGAAFVPARAGGWVLGVDGTVGHVEPGAAPTASRFTMSARVG